MERQPWERLPQETAKAYAAFQQYMRLPPRERSIDAAWESATNVQQTDDDKKRRAPRGWGNWSSLFDWRNRALAHDDHLSRLEQAAEDEKWLQRRKESREHDYTQAEILRAVVVDAIPTARGFLRSSRRYVEGEKGEPDREIITVQFDITGLSKVLTEVSRLQRLAVELPTDHTELSGAALDAYIANQLARLADDDEAGTGEPFGEDEPADAGPGDPTSDGA